MSSSSNFSWSDLPFEILTSVAECFPTFPMTELLLFGSVCKTWRQASLNVRLPRRLGMPWLIQVLPQTYIDGTLPGIRCDLSDFWSEQTLSFAQIRHKPLAQLLVHASCNGWLLLSDRTDGVTDRNLSLLWFLWYNPFRHMTIELPPLIVAAHAEIIVTRGTASPAAPDDDNCNVFVACGRPGPASGKIRTIYTYNLKDKKWRFQNLLPHEKQLHDVLYMDGAFYCVCAVDGALSVEMDVFTFKSDYAVSRQDPFIASSFSCSLSIKENDKLYLVEADGEFWLAIYSPDETRNCCHIYQFDRSGKEWSRVKSLGNRVLMLSCNVPVESIVLPAVQNAEQFANMILVLGRSTYDSYICEDAEGTWRFDKRHDLNPGILNNVRIEPPPLWR